MNRTCRPAPASGTPAVESCRDLHPPQACPPTPCPGCGRQGKSVARLTLGALLKPEARARIPAQEEFCFCRTPACEVVYFSDGKALFRKDDVAVPVGLKEPDDVAAPVCYCFGWTPERIRAEIERAGRSSAINQITAQVKAGNCYCEVTNPQGSCCLGNVNRVVQEALTRRNATTERR